MAYTNIHSITSTLNVALDYCTKDKEKLIKSNTNNAIIFEKNASGDVIKYPTINSGFNCVVDKAEQAFNAVRKFRKINNTTKLNKNNKENIAWHCIQNFYEKVDADTANEIGRKLAEECFGNFQCIISTHTNTDHTHNHILFNAWEFESGKKYHDCTDTYRKIRQVSDKLCKEYGLHTLEETKDYKLITWKDENGKHHAYEPTKRKSKIRIGEYVNANDYRNTNAHEMIKSFKHSNHNTIKNDIDRFKVLTNNYDELLDKLCDIGYEINAKNIHGNWLKHISYKAPGQERGTRDSTIGNEYTREYLENYFNGRTARRYENSQTVHAVQYYERDMYEYDKVNIDEINYDYRRRKNKDGNFETVTRQEVEKRILDDSKKLNSTLKKIYLDAMYIKREKAEPVLQNKRSQYLLNCINDNLKTLCFIEEKNICSFEQLNNMIATLYEKRNEFKTTVSRVQYALERYNENIAMLNGYYELVNRIENQKNNENYVQFEMKTDLDVLNNYEYIMKQRNLSTVEQQQTYKEKGEQFNKNFETATINLKKIGEQIQDYDDCVRTISRIDKQGVGQYEEEIKEFVEIKEENTIVPKQKKVVRQDESPELSVYER